METVTSANSGWRSSRATLLRQSLETVVLCLAISCTRASEKNAGFSAAFDDWRQCPGDSVGIVAKLDAFGRWADSLVGLSPDELTSILWSDTDEGVYLNHFAPFLAPSELRTAFAQSCWVHFESLSRRHRGIPSTVPEERTASARLWESCLRATYDSVPSRVQPIIDCLRIHDLRLTARVGVPLETADRESPPSPKSPMR
jgi:hypothetical protein